MKKNRFKLPKLPKIHLWQWVLILVLSVVILRFGDWSRAAKENPSFNQSPTSTAPSSPASIN